MTVLALFAAPASADSPPVEHFSFVGVDVGFSDFLTQACGFPVTATLNENDTFVNSNGVSVESIHITATVVGNGVTLTLRTDSISNGSGIASSGLVVQVFDANGHRLTQIAGQLRFLDDGTAVFHGTIPMFSLCDFLT
jgi:hypothetical protein